MRRTIDPPAERAPAAGSPADGDRAGREPARSEGARSERTHREPGQRAPAARTPARPARARAARPRFTPLQLAVHAAAWLPLGWLIWAALTDNLTINPIQAATQHTGRTAIILLLASLSITPLRTLTQTHELARLSRPLGLYAFLYAALHLAIFLWLDYGLDFELIWEAVIEKRFVLVGLATLLILAALAATSFQYWMKRLGKNWKRLHRLVYLAGGLAVLHYAWATKGDLFSLQGDVWKPLTAGAVLAVLLILRIPAVRKRAKGALTKASP